MMHKLIRTMVGHSVADHLLYRRHHRWLLRHLGLPNRKAPGEQAYIDKWRQLAPCVEPYSYRLFSHYCGPNPDIIPEDIMHRVVETGLNPPDYWPAYEDKNLFSRFLPAGMLPQTVLMRIAGGPILSADYTTASVADTLASCSFPALILKPSVGTSCGDGIRRFDRTDGRYVDNRGTVLTERLLLGSGPDIVLQQAVEQHPFMQQFCTSALSTLRLVTYRSVNDNLPHVTAAILRVGREGSIVDNISAGGRFVGVDIDTGRLGTEFIGRYGDRSPQWNGTDLAARRLTVPAWDDIRALALQVAARIPHHRLLALDIALDTSGTPILVEYNIGGFTTYFFHFTGQTVLGPYTDEVIGELRCAK